MVKPGVFRSVMAAAAVIAVAGLPGVSVAAAAGVVVTATVDDRCHVTVSVDGLTPADLSRGMRLTWAAEQSTERLEQGIVGLDLTGPLPADGVVRAELPGTFGGTVSVAVGEPPDRFLPSLGTAELDTGCVPLTGVLAGEGLSVGIETPTDSRDLSGFFGVLQVEATVGGATCTFPFPAEVHGQTLVGLADSEGGCGYWPAGEPVPTGAVSFTSLFYVFGTASERRDLLELSGTATAEDCAGRVCIEGPGSSAEVTHCPVGDRDALCPHLELTLAGEGYTVGLMSLPGTDPTTAAADLAFWYGLAVGERVDVTAEVVVRTAAGSSLTCRLTGPATVGELGAVVLTGKMTGSCEPSFFGEQGPLTATVVSYLMSYTRRSDGSERVENVPGLVPVQLVEHECSDPVVSCTFGFDPVPVPRSATAPVPAPVASAPLRPRFTG